jgi:hypothetical protein
MFIQACVAFNALPLKDKKISVLEQMLRELPISAEDNLEFQEFLSKIRVSVDTDEESVMLKMIDTLKETLETKTLDLLEEVAAKEEAEEEDEEEEEEEEDEEDEEDY